MILRIEDPNSDHELMLTGSDLKKRIMPIALKRCRNGSGFTQAISLHASATGEKNVLQKPGCCFRWSCLFAVPSG